MEYPEFERKFLDLVYRSDVTITAVNIAYHLGMPVAEAQDKLTEMELNGILVEEQDAKGDSYWKLPNRPQAASLVVSQAATPATAGAAGAPAASPSAAIGPALSLGISRPDGVSEGLPPSKIYGLLLNVIVPGTGSLVAGRTGEGIVQLTLAVLGLPLAFFVKWWLIVLTLFAWLWGVVSGVRGLMSSK